MMDAFEAEMSQAKVTGRSMMFGPPACIRYAHRRRTIRRRRIDGSSDDKSYMMCATFFAETTVTQRGPHATSIT